MDPNQLFVRRTQLGGRAWLWVFAVFVAATLARFAWYSVHQTPRVLGVEVATLLVLAAIALLPPCWALIEQARRRYRARGLLPHKLSGMASTFLAMGLLYGIVFPCLLAAELGVFGFEVAVPTSTQLWWAVGYLAKVGLALLLVRAGWGLLHHEPRSGDGAPESPPAP